MRHGLQPHSNLLWMLCPLLVCAPEPSRRMLCACTLTKTPCSVVQVPILLQTWCFWRVSSRLQPSLVRAKGWKHQHANKGLAWRAGRALHSRAAGSSKAPSSGTAAETNSSMCGLLAVLQVSYLMKSRLGSRTAGRETTT